MTRQFWGTIRFLREVSEPSGEDHQMQNEVSVTSWAAGQKNDGYVVAEVAQVE